MASDHTRTAILSAAERLYADRGFGDVTLRDIVAAAGVNLAAVNYHFGSKDELIAELFVTRSLATNRERLNELKAAEAAGGGSAPLAARTRSGRTLLGAAFRAGDGAPDHPRQRATDQTVGGIMRSQRRRRHPRPHRRDIGDGADRCRGGEESAGQAGRARRAVIVLNLEHDPKSSGHFQTLSSGRDQTAAGVI